MTQIDKDRFHTTAEAYDAMAPYFVPAYEFLQTEILRLLPLNDGRPRVFVDLGAGSGTMLGRILAADPRAICCWVDYSQDFLAVAQRKLAGYGDRVRFILSPMEEEWESQLPGPADAILSMSAIHHLDTQGKRCLYERCFRCLRAGGWFFNIDEMRTPHEDAYMNSLRFWVRHVEQAAPLVPAELHPLRDRWLNLFAGWQQRNVQNASAPRQAGDDVHEGFIEQVRWLREIGFVGADVFLKYHLWCAIGGRRPG